MSQPQQPVRFSDPQACVDLAIERLGHDLVIGAPLALGKPNHLVNAFYQHACENTALKLDIFTALSLDPPQAGRGLQRRFLEPFLKRHFGDYPRLAYLRDLAKDRIPPNVTISEFYFRSGAWLRNSHAQRHYVSSNYTHVARDMLARGVNVLVQMVGVHPDRPGFFSLSSNPDVTLEMRERLAGRDYLMIAQVNPDLPYMDGDAEVPESLFDAVLEGPAQPLFAVPRLPVKDQDYLIGLFASALIRDCGTLQLGIGSLGDAVAFLTVLRHRDNATYKQLLQAAAAHCRIPPATLEAWGGTEPFEEGLYAASEMFMDGFLHLYDAGVLKRRVYDHAGLQELINSNAIAETLRPDTLDVLREHRVIPERLGNADLKWLTRFGILTEDIRIENRELCCPDGERIPNEMGDKDCRDRLTQAALGERLSDGALLHAAFFLGSQSMYDTLRNMPHEERNLFRMTRVSRINQLYRGEAIDRVQRLNSRCINTTMKVTLLGAAVSDQVENGQVVSGVGGQYNFVAMAHALDNSRSLLMLRSFRESGGKAESNIVWEFPHATIPRHLRDIVITEYGVADLRGTSDEETIQRLLCIADSRWQESLRLEAVSNAKLDPDWRIPERFRRNTPANVREALATFRASGVISDYPNGSDFTDKEIRITRALAYLKRKGASSSGRIALMLRAAGPRGKDRPEHAGNRERMAFGQEQNWRERLDRRLFNLALDATES